MLISVPFNLLKISGEAPQIVVLVFLMLTLKYFYRSQIFLVTLFQGVEKGQIGNEWFKLIPLTKTFGAHKTEEQMFGNNLMNFVFSRIKRNSVFSNYYIQATEAAAGGFLSKKLFFFINKRPQHSCSRVNILKFSRIPLRLVTNCQRTTL